MLGKQIIPTRSAPTVKTSVGKPPTANEPAEPAAGVWKSNNRSPIEMVRVYGYVEAAVYQNGLRRRSITPAELDWQDDVDHLLGLTRTNDASALSGELHHLIDRALATGSELVLLACLDLSAVLARQPHARVIDTAQALARELVRQWVVLRDQTQGRAAK